MPIGYVSPQGVITLYKGVPLNPTYNDVLYIPSPESSYSYFLNYVYETINENTYSRVNNENKIRVGITAEKLYLCNYLSWSNHGFGTTAMNFFAFITNVEYINNNCTEITYVIDDMTTWFPYLRLKECFVERETPVSDELFENLVPENLELGEYVENAPVDFFELGQTYLMLITSTDADGNRPSIETDYSQFFINGTFTPLMYTTANCSVAQEVFGMADKVNQMIQNGYGENIIALWLVPEFVLKNARTDTWESERYAVEDWNIFMPVSINDYVPKNKKLLSSPYQKLLVTNLSGQNAEYHYEDFENPDDILFKVIGASYGLPSVIAEPRGYKNHFGVNPDYGILLTNFPQAPTINDTYKAYLAQNKASIATSILSSITSIGLGLGITVGSAGLGAMAGAGMIASGAVGVSSTLAKVSDAKASPTTVSGLIQNDCLSTIRNIVRLEARHVSIKKEMAECIDNYFSAFGYACHKVKVPNIMARNIWNFTKTQGCCVTGSAPAPAISNICNIFDRGVRFWKDPADIGNYQGNN